MSEASSTAPILGVIVILLVAILLVVTNASEEARRQAIASEIGRERPLAGAIGLGVRSAAVPTYHSFVLGSYTTEGDAIVSIGALGMVQVAGPAPR